MMIKMEKDEKAMKECREPDIEHFDVDDEEGGVSLLEMPMLRSRRRI
jgi:hypothetical protein